MFRHNYLSGSHISIELWDRIATFLQANYFLMVGCRCIYVYACKYIMTWICSIMYTYWIIGKGQGVLAVSGGSERCLLGQVPKENG